MADGTTLESIAAQAATEALAAALSDAVSGEVSDALPAAVNTAVAAAVPTAVRTEVASAVPTAVAESVPAAVAAAVNESLSDLPLDIFGAGTIGEEGTCSIDIDEGFDANTVYFVFLQKEGAGDLYVSEKGASSFTVTGTAGLAFAWNLKFRAPASFGEGE